MSKTRYSRLKSRAKRYGVKLPFTLEAFTEWFDSHRNDICHCGKPGTDIDHVVPLSRGGSHDLTNFQMLCRDCNFDKSNWLPGEQRTRKFGHPTMRRRLAKKRKKAADAPKQKLIPSTWQPTTSGGVQLRHIGGGRYEYDLSNTFYYAGYDPVTVQDIL